jgi:hypothetical protein
MKFKGRFTIIMEEREQTMLKELKKPRQKFRR